MRRNKKDIISIAGLIEEEPNNYEELVKQATENISQIAQALEIERTPIEKIVKAKLKHYEQNPSTATVINYLLKCAAQITKKDLKKSVEDFITDVTIKAKKEAGLIGQEEVIGWHFCQYYKSYMDPMKAAETADTYVVSLYRLFVYKVPDDLEHYRINDERAFRAKMFETLNLINASLKLEIPSGPISQQE